MAVMTWFYAQAQAVPVNYAKIDVADDELVFFGGGASNNYRQLIGQKADEFAGRAFITEYATPSHERVVSPPLLQERRHPAQSRGSLFLIIMTGHNIRFGGWGVIT